MRIKSLNFIFVVLLLPALGGCVGVQTFHETARAGDTVALAVGWKHYFARDNITVTITPSSGSTTVYLPNDPAVRAVINLYPDPLSSLVVSAETKQDLTPSAQTYASLVSSIFTKGDKDWWETTVFVDLPDSLPGGSTIVNITNPQGESVSSEVVILDGIGYPTTFETTFGPTNSYQLASMERVGHYVVQFSGSTIPYAIQLDMTHNPDVDHGGAGRAYAVNPRGDIKNVAWRDDGSNMRVILNPAKGLVLNKIIDFKFYVTGGITGLQLIKLKAVDINGNAVAGVTASIAWGG